MILFPAIDLRDGRAVRLVQGDFDNVTVFNDDPVAQARLFAEQGATHLHVVDLDGALEGGPVHAHVVASIAAAFGGTVHYGGGMRSRAAIETAIATGVDRVEMAYAQHLIATAADRLVFTALTPRGGIAPLPYPGAVRFIAALDAVWRGAGEATAQHRAAVRFARRVRYQGLVPGVARLGAAIGRRDAAPIYLLVSHHHLERSRAIARLKARTGARFLALIHDAIPAQYPEYSGPRQPKRHRRRLATVDRLADGVIVNSHATKAALADFIAPDMHRRIVVAPLGVAPELAPPDGGAAPAELPYFVCVGTIEAKKNHRLLLLVWQRLDAELGRHAPRLVLVGRQGWMVAETMAQLRDTPALRRLVTHHPALADAEMARLVGGACASLQPSLAEGYGLTVAESLALGVPVLCSDLPVLREVGGGVPDYLDPGDPAAWEAAIRAFAEPRSPRRAAQVSRLAAWPAPRWRDHFAIVQPLLDGAVMPDRARGD